MEFAIAIFTALFLLVITDLFTQKKPPKTPEQEFGEAFTKYLAEHRKQKEEKKDQP